MVPREPTATDIPGARNSVYFKAEKYSRYMDNDNTHSSSNNDQRTSSDLGEI